MPTPDSSAPATTRSSDVVPRTIRTHRDRILAAIDLGLSNGKLEGLDSKIRLINHRGYGHHTAAALIGMIYLCCGGITIELPTQTQGEPHFVMPSRVARVRPWAPGESQTHTGTEVRVAGYGPQAANIVGLTDQTDLFATMSRALGLE
ncbi:MAG: hypothetical protein GEV09_23375 [Pseudonocardiaceae bacterium]|nr:hypothetical protein [Pseudonocardiaceae bacterium]